MEKKNNKVIIIGAGLGGLILANSLINNGKDEIDFEIYERDKGPMERIQGYYIGLNTIGLQVIKKSVSPNKFKQIESLFVYNQVSMVDRNLNRLFEIKTICRKKLRDILIEGININFGKKLSTYEEDSSGVTAIFEDGSTVHGDILIGCDGVHSNVRRKKIPDFEIEDLNVYKIQCLIPKVPNEIVKQFFPENENQAIKILGIQKNTLVIIRTKNIDNNNLYEGIFLENEKDSEMLYIHYEFRPLPGSPLPNGKEEMLNEIKKGIHSYHPSVTTLIGEYARPEGFIDNNPISLTQAGTIPQFTTSRVTLLGDSIHQMSHHAGLGGNIAMEDAYEFSIATKKIFIDNLDLIETISEYENQMVIRGSKAIKTSRFKTEQMHSRELGIISETLYRNAKVLKWNQILENPIALSQYGYLEQLKINKSLLVDRNLIQDCGKRAARFGHIHVLEFIIEEFKNRFGSTEYIYESFFKGALSGGNIKTIEYSNQLIQGYYIWKFAEYLESTALGTVEACIWLVDQYPREKLYSYVNTYNISNFYRNAAMNGNIDILKWGTEYFQNRSNLTQQTWFWSLYRNDYTILNYMYNHELFNASFKCILIEDTLRWIKINTLIWLLSVDKPPQFEYLCLALSNLVRRGSIKIIKFIYQILRDRKEFYTNNIADWFFKFCQDEGFNAIDFAFKIHSFKVIRWILENTQHCSSPKAFNSGFLCSYSMEIIVMFTQNKRKVSLSSESLNFLLKDKKNFNTVEYILRNRTESFPDIVFDYVIENSSSMELPNWFIKNRKEKGTTNAMDGAIARNDIALVKWIHENTKLGCSEKGIISAYHHKTSTLVEWIHQNRTEKIHPVHIKFNYHKYSKEVKTYIIYHQPEMKYKYDSRRKY